MSVPSHQIIPQSSFSRFQWAPYTFVGILKSELVAVNTDFKQFEDRQVVRFSIHQQHWTRTVLTFDKTPRTSLPTIYPEDGHIIAVRGAPVYNVVLQIFNAKRCLVSNVHVHAYTIKPTDWPNMWLHPLTNGLLIGVMGGLVGNGISRCYEFALTRGVARITRSMNLGPYPFWSPLCQYHVHTHSVWILCHTGSEIIYQTICLQSWSTRTIHALDDGMLQFEPRSTVMVRSGEYLISFPHQNDVTRMQVLVWNVWINAIAHCKINLMPMWEREVNHNAGRICAIVLEDAAEEEQLTNDYIRYLYHTDAQMKEIGEFPVYLVKQIDLWWSDEWIHLVYGDGAHCKIVVDDILISVQEI